MDKMMCGNDKCSKVLDTSMEIEFSRKINQFYCSPDCARDSYFDYMDSVNVDVNDQELLDSENVKVVNGNFIYID
jgi:hypothetical protein